MKTLANLTTTFFWTLFLMPFSVLAAPSSQSLPAGTPMTEESAGEPETAATDPNAANPGAEAPIGPQQEYLIEVQGIKRYPQWLELETKILDLVPKGSFLKKYKVTRGSYLVWVKSSMGAEELRSLLSSVRIQEQTLRFPQNGDLKTDSGETIALRVGVP